MKAEEYHTIIKELMSIPCVGIEVAENMVLLGIKNVNDLKNQKAEYLYMRSNNEAGKIQDRQWLYVFRCAIYYASTQRPEKNKLDWTSWKD